MRATNARMMLKCVLPLVLFCGLSAGCSGSDPEPDYTCGNDICETTKGEDNSVCPDDCKNYVCGNELCETASGETTDNCPADCLVCAEPFSVNCGDGFCWSEETDCATGPFVCGGIYYRCNTDFPYANCCYSTFRLCPAIARYWCPANDLCYASLTNCPTRCQYHGLSCY